MGTFVALPPPPTPSLKGRGLTRFKAPFPLGEGSHTHLIRSVRPIFINGGA